MNDISYFINHNVVQVETNVTQGNQRELQKIALLLLLALLREKQVVHYLVTCSVTHEVFL